MAPAIADLRQVVDDSALLAHDSHGYSRRTCAITGAFQVQEIGRLPKIIMPPRGGIIDIEYGDRSGSRFRPSQHNLLGDGLGHTA